MSWGAPAYLWLLAALPPLLGISAWGAHRRARDLRAIGGAGDREGRPAQRGFPLQRWCRWRGRLLVVISLTLLVAALCRPRWGAVAEERRARGIDIMVALDTSRSMAADDLAPSRLAAAKGAVAALAGRLEGDRIGLIAFAGSAFTVCPLTSDYSLFRTALSETGVDTIPHRGTSLAAALQEGGRTLPGQGDGGRVLIVISDGEDHGPDYRAAAEKLRRAGVLLYCVAAGTAQGGLIPEGEGAFHQDRRGAVVKTRLQREPLRRIASIGRGRALDLAAAPGLTDLYLDDLRTLARVERSERRLRLEERFQVPLALALCLLAVEPLVRHRRKR